MKRKGMLNKTLLAVVSILVTGIVFTGCSSSATNTSATAVTASSDASASTTDSSSSDSSDPASDIKTSIESAVKELVTAGTINSDQGTKIIEALTSRGDKMQGSKPDGEKPSGGQGNIKQQTDDSNSGGTKQSGGRMNPLSTLVEDNTITQAQADAVMEKVQSIMPQGGKHNKGNSTDSSSSSKSS